MISLPFRLGKDILRPMIVERITRLAISLYDTKHIFSRLSINQKGFTLIEIMVSIVVMAIIGVISGVGLVEISKGYVFSKRNTIVAQQGQIAMARLKKEFGNIKAVSSVTQTSITFTRSSDGSTHSISWAGGNSPLSIDGDTLIGTVIDPVTSFNIAYYDSYNSPASSYSTSTSIIEIALQLVVAEDSRINFTDRVNLYLETGG
jgi:prepilin-type N-terminal cleavage/methylation domain-containing protein